MSTEKYISILCMYTFKCIPKQNVNYCIFVKVCQTHIINTY